MYRNVPIRQHGAEKAAPLLRLITCGGNAFESLQESQETQKRGITPPVNLVPARLGPTVGAIKGTKKCNRDNTPLFAMAPRGGAA
jgi:hypothetical protein